MLKTSKALEIRDIISRHCYWKDGGLLHGGVRGAGHGAPHPHRGGQLRQLLQRAEEARGGRVQEGGAGEGAGLQGGHAGGHHQGAAGDHRQERGGRQEEHGEREEPAGGDIETGKRKPAGIYLIDII